MKYRENAQDTWHDLNIKALDSMEIGSIIAFAGDTIPTGWLVCDGSSITQSAYPELYALIGGTLPNFKGRTLVGKDSNDTAFDTLLDTGGEKAVQLTTDNLASNVISTSTTGSNTDGYIMRGGYTASGTYNIGGSGVAHNNLQPYAVINWIIKATNTTPTMASVVNTYSTSTTDTYSCDYLNDSDSYSTSEVKTNQRWIDGKPIYRYVYHISALPNNDSQTYNLSISNVDMVVSLSGSAFNDTAGNFFPLPYIGRWGGNVNDIELTLLSRNQIRIITQSDRSSYEAYVYIEYTKTTD